MIGAEGVGVDITGSRAGCGGGKLTVPIAGGDKSSDRQEKTEGELTAVCGCG